MVDPSLSCAVTRVATYCVWRRCLIFIKTASSLVLITYMSDGLLALTYTAVEAEKKYISGYGVSVESSVAASVFPRWWLQVLIAPLNHLRPSRRMLSMQRNLLGKKRFCKWYVMNCLHRCSSHALIHIVLMMESVYRDIQEGNGGQVWKCNLIKKKKRQINCKSEAYNKHIRLIIEWNCYYYSSHNYYSYY